jgi:hypothetical protein
MNVTNYTWSEVQREAQKLTAKVIKEHVDREISVNNYKKGDKEWYALERVKQHVVEAAHLGNLS